MRKIVFDLRRVFRFIIRGLPGATSEETDKRPMAAANIPEYPWFGVVDGDDIEQGDIFEKCPVFVPPAELALTAEGNPANAEFTWQERDLIVMSQSCDLEKDRERLEEIVFCAVWQQSEMTDKLAKVEMLEEARKGRLPNIHLIAASTSEGFEREVRIVDFRRVYSLPVKFVRNRATLSKRLRLLPPYREHLSQSFARFFMRVGLPIDIPPFTGKKK